MVDKNYEFVIKGEDFSDIVDMEGFQYTLTSFSAKTATGQDKTGYFNLPILGERVQLAFRMVQYVPVARYKRFVTALEMGTKGQREITVTYDDPAFGVISHKFYCTNVNWLKYKLPNPPHNYVKDVSIQMASSYFLKYPVATDTPKLPIITNPDSNYRFRINGKEFNDFVDIDGYRGQLIDQSLESETGLTLDGKFHLPIIGSRTQMEINAPMYVEVGRFRQIVKELGFGKTGQRSHKVEYFDEVMGNRNVDFYCTSITGTRVKLPDYPYHYMKDVRFQQAMKQFF